MHINIVQGAFLPVPAVRGGAVEKIWSALGREFAARGHQVTHISQQYSTLERRALVDGVQHVRVPGFEMPKSGFALKWRDFVYSRRVLDTLPKADLIVTNTFWLPIIAPRVKRGKIYVHVARYPKGQMNFYRKAARLQTVSTVIGKAICEEAPGLAARVRVIPYFVSRVGRSDECDREKVILYVGRIHPEKGVHLLMEAFERLVRDGASNWRLRIVGPWQTEQGGGGEEYLNMLRERAQNLGPLVEWTGPIFDEEVLFSHYRRSAFFVYPSLAERGETFGLAPLEAMAGGCPPVVSALECFRDFVKPGVNGWIFDHRSEDSVGTLTKVLEPLVFGLHPLNSFRDSALQTAADYSLAKIASQYLQDFQEVLST